MRYDIERFLLAVMPLLIAAFCILVISLFCENKWAQIFLELPVWAAVLWWIWVNERDRYDH